MPTKSLELPTPSLDRSPEVVRSEVEQAYSAAIERTSMKKTSCCGAPSGAAARSAGYDEEIAVDPTAAASSFGCGNPLALAGIRPGETIVDLGSGAGFDLLIAARKVGPEGKVIGVDMTDAMISAARRNAQSAGLASIIEVRKGIIEELPVDDGEADWVVSNCVVNLSPQKSRVFSEIHRVLRPGGRFSISDIVADDLPARLLEHTAAYAACIAGAISEPAYLSGLRDAGLVDVQAEERQVYDAAQIRGIVESDLEDFGLPDDTFGDIYESLEGKVASVRFRGRKRGGDTT